MVECVYMIIIGSILILLIAGVAICNNDITQCWLVTAYIVLAQITGTASSVIWWGSMNGPNFITEVIGAIIAIPIVVLCVLICFAGKTCWTSMARAYESSMADNPAEAV